MPKLDISLTPNPNSLKCALSEGTFIPEGMESFNSAEEAAGHALGERLFRIGDIVNVFITPRFLTITKNAEADWNDILPKVKRTVKDTR